MDPQQPKALSEEAKLIVFKQLVKASLDAVGNNMLTPEKKDELVTSMLQRTDIISTYPELVSYLEELSALYPFFKDILLQIKEDETEHKDTAQITNIVSEIRGIKE